MRESRWWIYKFYCTFFQFFSTLGIFHKKCWKIGTVLPAPNKIFMIRQGDKNWLLKGKNKINEFSINKSYSILIIFHSRVM